MRRFMIMALAAGIMLTGCQSENPQEAIEASGENEAVGAEVQEDYNEQDADESSEANETSAVNEEQGSENTLEEIDTLPNADDIQVLLSDAGINADDPQALLGFINSIKADYGRDTMDALVSEALNKLENMNKDSYNEKASAFLSVILDNEDVLLNDDSYNKLLAENAEFKAFANDLQSKGLKITYSVHWNPFVDVSYETLDSLFADHVSDEMEAYLGILSTESNMHYIGSSYDDLGRGISLDELVSRIIATENFMAKYPESSMTETVTLYNMEYLYEYLYGHTKYDTSFDWMGDTVTLYPEFDAHYKATIVNHADSELVKLLKKYMSSIEENDGALDLSKERLVKSPESILKNHIWTE